MESIDLGDATGPRTVVSGLVKFVAAEALLGARVVCLCNLKPAAMRGVVSQAMVLCASDEAHTRVELVTPPEGAVVGEAVTFAGFANTPDAQLNPKKKVWEAVQPTPPVSPATAASSSRRPPACAAWPALRRASLNEPHS